MDKERSQDTKRKWFLWGIALAWIPFSPTVKFLSVMNAQDLANAAPGIEKAVRQHGKAA